ncbi:unnamed protein product [Linum tenue]|uniref:Neprosin PEP catalytic domain-containing protein n=1 Tax=Linum tenue TaxID=586396 RepID=A0AAV0JYX5_9ROSI|nr:unnamed protein product [Linum tenue]
MSSFDFRLEQGTNGDSFGFDPSKIWLNGKGCPPNTVPIKRITKQDLIGANIAGEIAYNNSLNINTGVEVAVLRTTRQNKLYGAGMTVSVYHPAVQGTQYSSAHIKFQNGPDSISVGWAVNPSLYPDKETRLFIYTITKNSHCYNTFCPGFVILSPNVPVDLLLKPYSKIGGPTYETNLFVRKRATNGDWFLAIGKDVPIGFWPQRIFTGLADSANYVEWGGEVYSPPGTSPPPMGAGHLPTGKLYDNCYGRQVTLIGENQEIDHNPPSCQPYSNSKGYKLVDAGVVRPPFDRTIAFGGNGL